MGRKSPSLYYDPSSTNSLFILAKIYVFVYLSFPAVRAFPFWPFPTVFCAGEFTLVPLGITFGALGKLLWVSSLLSFCKFLFDANIHFSSASPCIFPILSRFAVCSIVSPLWYARATSWAICAIDFLAVRWAILGSYNEKIPIYYFFCLPRLRSFPLRRGLHVSSRTRIRIKPCR